MAFPIPVLIAIVLLVIALFLLTLFSSFIRWHSNRPSTSATAAAAVNIPIFTPTTTSPLAPISLVRGLDQTVIDTFPSFDYSAVISSSYGIGTGNVALECYVCLNEFEADETLRLIPVCDHAFHVGCIDAWLASNATCPVCRANLHDRHHDLTHISEDQNDDVVVNVNSDHHQDPPTSRSALPKLRRALTWRKMSSGKARFGTRFARSKSTGRVAVMERFTLRVPEEVRREIIVGKLRRCMTSGRGGGEESSWRRWFFRRSKSMEVPKVVTSASNDSVHGAWVV